MDANCIALAFDIFLVNQNEQTTILATDSQPNISHVRPLCCAQVMNLDEEKKSCKHNSSNYIRLCSLVGIITIASGSKLKIHAHAGRDVVPVTTAIKKATANTSIPR